MPREKKSNILYILNVLKKYSDDDHVLSSNKISKKVEEDYNITIDPRTVRRNIDSLVEYGYDIEKTNAGCFIRKDPDTEFESGELSAILNTFAYSNFIPEKMAKTIIDKCFNMMDLYDKDKYKNYKISLKNTRTENKEIIKNIEDINEAIYRKRKIKFKHYKYSLINKLEYTCDKTITTSPYKLIYALQKFYLICMDDGKKELYSHRLDRMKDIEITNEKVSKKFDDNEVDFFIKSNVNMLSGNTEKVEIECDMALLDNVVELYGKDIKLEKIDNHKFRASFYTTIKGFRYWCLRNIETVKVISPKSLVNDIKKTIKEKNVYYE